MGQITDDFVQHVQQWRKAGVIYQHRSQTRFGADCIGMIIGCLQEMGYLRGYQVPEYPPDWNLHAMAGDHIRENLIVVADQVPKMPAQPGDMPLFTFGPCVAHIGVVTTYPVFVHIHVGPEKIGADSLHTGKWQSRWVETWRLNEAKVRGTA